MIWAIILKKLLMDYQSESPLYDKFLLNEQRYEDLEKVDEGGTKSISVVYDEQTYRPIAMAKLKQARDKEKYDSFLSEALLTASLEHPNIVPLYEAGLDENDCPYFTMKLIKGQNGCVNRRWSCWDFR